MKRLGRRLRFIFTLVLLAASVALWIDSYTRCTSLLWYPGDRRARMPLEMSLGTNVGELSFYAIREPLIDGAPPSGVRVWRARVDDTQVVNWFPLRPTVTWTTSSKFIGVPLVYPTLFLLAMGCFDVRAMLRPARSGHCPACGYDMRATPERCPECGLEAERAGTIAGKGDT
jgi:hypothetical protein